MPTATEVWNKLAKELGLPLMEDVLRYMRAIKDVAAWALNTEHTEAAKEVKAILFRHFPEILGPN